MTFHLDRIQASGWQAPRYLLKQRLGNENLTARRARAEPRGQVYRVSDHGVIHSLGRTYDPSRDWPAIHTNADLQGALASGFPTGVESHQRALHIDRRFHRAHR